MEVSCSENLNFFRWNGFQMSSPSPFARDSEDEVPSHCVGPGEQLGNRISHPHSSLVIHPPEWQVHRLSYTLSPVVTLRQTSLVSSYKTPVQ